MAAKIGVIISRLPHIPTMTYGDGLNRQRVGGEACKHQRHFGDVFQCGEFAIDRLSEHDFLSVQVNGLTAWRHNNRSLLAFRSR